MVSLNTPKVLLVTLLVITTIGSFLGITNYMKTVPSTGTTLAPVLNGTTNFATLEDFVHFVKNGQSTQVVGVYIPGILALPVGQQPKNNAGFVTRNPDEATQFSMAGQYGTVGILAHNDLAGSLFPKIHEDQYAIIVYGDGHLEYYVVDEIQEYQALTPTSTFSDFVNLSGSHDKLSAAELFTRIYAPGDRLVFQTCIEAQGDPSWGRIFIIARPATRQVLSMVQQTSFLLQFASFGMAAH